MKSTDINQFLEDLNAGVFGEQIGRAISEVATGVASHGKNGKVTVTFDIKRIGESQQINIKHGLKYVAPTSKGKRSEEYQTETPMHVNPGGEVTLFPINQGQLFPKGQTTN